MYDMVTVGGMCNFDLIEEYLNLYLAKRLINLYRRYKDRKTYFPAVTIQCLFRSYSSRKVADILRMCPDNLFNVDYSVSRKRKIDIDDSCFKNNST